MIDHGDLTRCENVLSCSFRCWFQHFSGSLGGYAVLQAQQKTFDGQREALVRSSLPGPIKRRPTKDAVVTIEKDMNVVLDVLLRHRCAV